MKQYSIIILATALLATACTKEIEYKGPDSERMLIVNSITESGRVPVFKISHSAFFLDSYYSGNELKSGVSINVDINGVTRDAAYVDSLKGYTDGRVIAGGDIISVKASHAQYGTATASDTVPHAQDFILTQYTKEYVPAHTMSEMFDDYFYDFNQDEVDSIWVTEIDIPGHDNNTDYYLMTIEPVMTYFMYDEYEDRYDTMAQAIHFKIPAETKVFMGMTDATTAVLEDTEADSQFEFGNKSFIFDDLYIKDGNKLSFDIVMEKPDTTAWIYSYVDDNDILGGIPVSVSGLIKDEVVYTLDIKLYVLSRAYYYYHKSVKDFEDADELSFLSEPVTILHNVTGGAGILATYASKTFHYERTYKFK
ncbi:MAG: DUF4249 family protein [Bacteroidaceae bacterium]|nr:DUF4249 family protein [Bacteroidaceae bacterium]